MDADNRSHYVSRALIDTERAKGDTGTARRYRKEARERRLLIEFCGWRCRVEGEDGLGIFDHPRANLRFVHSVATELDGETWAHVSVSRRDQKMPTWEQLRDTWRLIYPDVLAVVVIPPEDKHVNLAEVAHAWGCLTKQVLPDFTHNLGSI